MPRIGERRTKSSFAELYSQAKPVTDGSTSGGSLNVAEAIRSKRAVRAFLAEPIPDEVVQEILNAGRLSQSSKNEQLWQFIAIRKRDVLEALAQCGPWAGHLATAALGIAILTPDPAAKFQTMFDAGQAAALMQLAAWECGVGSCLATIYEAEQAREILMFPGEWHLRIAISFGYPRVAEPGHSAARKSGRRRFAEVVHFDHW